MAKELSDVDKELAEKKRLLALASKAPSAQEMRAAVAALFKEKQISPIEELIKTVQRKGKGALTAKEKIPILRFLAEYEAAKPKTMDIQQDTNMNVSVGLMDFTHTPVSSPRPTASDEQYAEFAQPLENID